jgi:hypothetical protein
MRIAYFENGRAEILGSARASRAGDRALAIALSPIDESRTLDKVVPARRRN